MTKEAPGFESCRQSTVCLEGMGSGAKPNSRGWMMKAGGSHGLSDMTLGAESHLKPALPLDFTIIGDKKLLLITCVKVS